LRDIEFERDARPTMLFLGDYTCPTRPND
jgi:hypothetical protein